MTTLTGHAAIDHASRHGLTLSKYADPTEGAREGLTVEQAREVAAEDPALIWCPGIATTADTISARFGDDGQKFTNAAGERLSYVCDEVAVDVHRNDERDATRYQFADGSAIIIAGDGWDLGIAGATCHCWAGAGHAGGCPQAE